MRGESLCAAHKFWGWGSLGGRPPSWLFSPSFCRWSLAGAAADAGRRQQFRLHQWQLHRCMYFTPANQPRLPDTHHTQICRAVSGCVSAASTSKRQCSRRSTNAACLGRSILVPPCTLCLPMLMCTQEMFLRFCQQLKDVCILMGQSRLIPNVVICRLLSALYF